MKFIKRIYKLFKKCEDMISISGGFMMILAFVIVLPNLEEIGYAWLGSFLALMVAINIALRRIEDVFPEIKSEWKQNQLLNKLKTEIEFLERRIKKHEKKKNIHIT